MKLKKILAGLLAGAMVLSSVPATALAAGDGRELEVIDDDPTPAASEVLEEGQESVPVAYTAEESVTLEEITIPVSEENHSNIRTNSEQVPAGYVNDGPAWWAFDGNDAHWWHSRYQNEDQRADTEALSGDASADNPIWIEAALGERKAVKQIKYTPRTGSNGHGAINHYEIYVANMDDPATAPTDANLVCVMQGNLASTQTEKTIDLPVSVAATHVRIQVTSVHTSENQYVTAKSIKIFENTAVKVENAVNPNDKVAVVGYAANSEQDPAAGNDGPASYAFNNNDSNWWHSHWSGTLPAGQVSGVVSEQNPIWIQAYFGETAKNISKIIYASRNNGNTNAPNAYEIFAANCPGENEPEDSNFVSIASGNAEYGGPQTILLPFVVEATHIRIQVTSVHDGQHVTARRIGFYQDAEAADVHPILKTIDYIPAAVKDETMGSIKTVSGSAMLENTDTVVGMKAMPKPGYRFVGWVDADNNVVSTDRIMEVTVNSNTPREIRFWANFEWVGYKESLFWDEEMENGTLATQDADEMWHYQIKGDTGHAGVWTDISDQYLYGTQWLQNGGDQHDTYHYAKISRDELTSTFGTTGEAVAYAWRAPKAGYYRATLESDITNGKAGAQNAMELFVTHVDHTMLQSDGKLLYEGNIGKADGVSKNFTSKVAKVEAGDYIRIGATKKDTWVQGFLPMVESVSVRDYAAERAADIKAAIAANVYSESSAATLTTRATELETAAQSTDNTDADVETALTALETAVQGADVALSVKYDNPTVGQALTITDSDKLFYDNANVLAFDVLFKFTNTDVQKYIPLVTLSDGQGEFITMWFKPKHLDVRGASAIYTNGTPTGLSFSRNSYCATDGKWHKLTLTVNKDGRLYIIADGNTGNGLDWTFVNSNWASTMDKIKSNTVDHDWSVKEVLVGKKATNGVYGGIDDSTGIVDPAEADGLQVKYVRVYSKNYTGKDQLNDKNSEATFKNGNTEEWQNYNSLAGESLNADDYMDEGWDAYQTALTNGRNKTVDRDVLNAAEEIAAAKAALQRAATVTLASRGHGNAAAELTLNGTAATSGKVERGTQVTVVAPATVTEGDVTYTFAYWADATGTDRKVSTDATYTFYPFVHMSLVAVYEASAETTEPATTTVVFRTTDRFSGMVWEATADEAGENIQIPAAPSFIGYNFDGWYSVDEGTPVEGLKSSGTVALSELGGHKEFEARYTKAETCDVTFKGCGTITTTDPDHLTIAENGTVTLVKDTQVTVTAPEGITFGGWYINDELVSASTTYKFWVKGTTTIEARTAETAVTSAVPLAAFQIAERKEAGSAKLSMAWDAPEGCEIVEIGILRAYADTNATFDTATMTVDNTAISRTRCSKLGLNGSYTLSVTISSAARQAQTIYARGYIVYKAADGSLAYAYTNCVGLNPDSTEVAFTEQAQ